MTLATAIAGKNIRIVTGKNTNPLLKARHTFISCIKDVEFLFGLLLDCCLLIYLRMKRT
jgi:hypothetical protein